MGQQNLEIIDKSIKSGEHARARKLLRQILREKNKKFSRKETLQIAEICRRVGWPHAGVKLLRPRVRPTGKAIQDAKPEEEAEYAASLTLIGAAPEAQGILQTINYADCAKALLYQAFACFAQWDYQEALQPLEQYLQHPQITGYDHLVGRINYMAALVACEKYEKAHHLLVDFLEQSPRHRLLHMNALEILIQACIFLEDYKGADQSLDAALKLSAHASMGYSLLIEKWKAILELYEHKVTDSRLEALEKVRHLARQQQRWEVIRDCDFFLSQFRGDKRLAKHLFFGTPFPPYRKRIIASLNVRIEDGETCLWQVTPAKAKEGSLTTVDVLRGLVLPSNQTDLKPGQNPHRLLQVLCSDFYRPLRIATVFSSLFPGEHYHPIYSSQRVHQALIRLRKWFSENKIKAVLGSNKNACFLQSQGSVGFLVTAPDSDKRPLGDEWLFERLHVGKDYSISELVEILQRPRRSTQRLVQNAVEQGILVFYGAARARKYRLKNS